MISSINHIEKYNAQKQILNNLVNFNVLCPFDWHNNHQDTVNVRESNNISEFFKIIYCQW